MSFKGKKILLITPILFHYHITLKNELEKMGAKVLFFPDQPKDAFTALKRKLFPKISKRYYQKIFNKIKDEEIDFFLLINGKGITRSFIEKLRLKNPKAKFVTYQWDSITRNNLDRKTNFLYFLDLFDRCFSFDLDDAKKIKELNYLPNFHTVQSGFKSEEIKKDIDLLLVATYSDDRYKFVNYYKEILKKEGLNFHFHLYLPWHHFLRFKILKRKKIAKKLIRFNTIDKDLMQNLYKRSKAVVDIPYENQTGFTMRIMEGIAYNCHVYTTNTLIANEGFYAKENITIFNKNNFKDLLNNFKKPTFSIKGSDISKLYITNWISKIFEN